MYEPLRIWLRQMVMADMPAARRNSYLCFDLALLIALASQQFIGPVKVAIFMDLVGTDREPVAKSMVLIVLVPVLVGYSILVSLLASPRKLVTVVCGFYGVLNLLVTVVHFAADGRPGAWLAWVLYYATETRGVIIMPMIWSVIADVSTPDLSKKAYPVTFFVVQIGGILGSLVAIQVTDLGGEVGLLAMNAASFILIAALSIAACSLADAAAAAEPDARTAALNQGPAEGSGQTSGGEVQQAQVPAQAAAPDCGPNRASLRESCGAALAKGMEQIYNGFEGLWLLLTRPYVFMAFWVSYAALMPRTILDYQNSVLGVAAYGTRSEQIAFFGKVNMFINIGTAVVTLLGTRPIVEALGVGYSLLVLPVFMAIAIAALCLSYSLTMSTTALVAVCIVAYSLNSPCKEMLYVRTSRDIKYKAKSWSEMYGNQIMKLFGAQVNLWVNRESDYCQPQCFRSGPTASVSFAWVGVWLGVAATIGAQHRQLEREDKTVS